MRLKTDLFDARRLYVSRRSLYTPSLVEMADNFSSQMTSKSSQTEHTNRLEAFPTPSRRGAFRQYIQ